MDSIILDPRFTNPRIAGPRPPLCGGAPDEELDGAAPQEREPEQTTREGEQPFRLEDIKDESQREYLRRRETEMQSGYSKRLNEELAKTAELTELQGRLDDPETQAAALAEFAAKYGVELEFEEETPPADPETDPALARLEALEAAEASRSEKDQQAQEAAREAQFHASVTAGLTALAEQEKVVDEGGNPDPSRLPEEVREHVLANAIALPRLENGLLDMSGAIKSYQSQVDFYRQRTQAGYVASKDTPVVDLSSEPADPQIDISSKAARIKASEAIAGRHL